MTLKKSELFTPTQFNDVLKNIQSSQVRSVRTLLLSIVFELCNKFDFDTVCHLSNCIK